MSNSPDLLKHTEVTDTELQVTDTELQNQLCNLRSENESLRQELAAANKQLAEWDKELDQLHARNGDLGLQVQMLQSELDVVKTDRPEIQESVPAVADFPEADTLLNQVRARLGKKSKAVLPDIITTLEILREAKNE